MRYTQEGWPSEVPEELGPYFQRRTELGIGAGCLFRGTRVIVPPLQQKEVLAELHSSHPGIVRMKKGLARSYVWWPVLSKAIADCI